MLKTIFAWDSARYPKLAGLMDEAREDGLAYMAFPREHLGINGEIKRRSDVIGIFPNDRALLRRVGALMWEQNDEWTVSRRYMSLKRLVALSDDPALGLSAVAV